MADTVLRRVACEQEECTHRGSVVDIFEDTVTPVKCGGCGATLLCEHPEVETSATLEGTVGSPLHVVRQRCRECGEPVDERRTQLTAEQVRSLPASALLGGVPLEVSQ